MHRDADKNQNKPTWILLNQFLFMKKKQGDYKMKAVLFNIIIHSCSKQYHTHTKACTETERTYNEQAVFLSINIQKIKWYIKCVYILYIIFFVNL